MQRDMFSFNNRRFRLEPVVTAAPLPWHNKLSFLDATVKRQIN
jgi:hypothetical protein